MLSSRNLPNFELTLDRSYASLPRRNQTRYDRESYSKNARSAFLQTASWQRQVKFVQLTWQSVRCPRCKLQEAIVFLLTDDTIGQNFELVEVVIPPKRRSAERMRAGDGDLIFDPRTHPRASAKENFHACAKRLLTGVTGVVALGPLGGFASCDAAPELERTRSVPAFRKIAINVMPRSILKRHGKNVHDGVVQG